MRRTLFAALVVASAAFSFTQLGFISIPLPDGETAYVTTMLLIVAIAALLLGTPLGTALGLIAGGVMCLHAQYLPLDHFELLFVTPDSSVTMLAVAGFVFGLLFAFALRNNPSQSKRVIYMAIISIFVTLAYAFFFFVNASVSLIFEMQHQLGDDLDVAYAQELGTSLALRLGNVQAQMLITIILLTLICSVNDYVARKAIQRSGTLHLRSVFAIRLGVVCSLAFLAMAAASFCVTTNDELRDAEDDMSGKAAYISNQVRVSNGRIDSLQNIITDSDIDVENVDFDDVFHTVASDSLLTGYESSSDGSILIMYDDTILEMTNDPQIADAIGSNLHFSSDMSAAIANCLNSGKMQRFVYDENSVRPEDSKTQIEEIINPQIMYLFAEKVEPTDTMPMAETIIVMQPSSKVFEKRASVMIWTTLSSLVMMLAVFLLVSRLINRLVSRRINETNDALARVTAGDLHARVNVHDTQEFESLSQGINTTVEALEGWIAEAESRMDAELATAKAIQESALPRTFPPFPDILRFDVYALMNAAREVGGDFYDFFLIGEHDPLEGKLGFLVADVSGKGVPAALFMMKAKTLIRDYLESGVELGEAISEVNHQLCEGNDAEMFVTAWVGVLDYATGHVDYVNAGHNPPLLWQFDGGWRWLEKRSGLPLGLFDDMPYQALSVECETGDTFLVYSDGVTEAMDVDKQLFGEERLMELAQDSYALHPQPLVRAVRTSVAAHAQGAEQSDDITILALEVGVPPETTSVLEVPAAIDELDNVNAFIHRELDQRLCPHRTQSQLDIAVEELFVNVCRYAYPDASPQTA